MIHVTMWTYPWDVIDEGIDRVFGIFKEEMGLDGMSVSTAYHNCDCLRTHMPGKKIYSSYDDCIYFQPQIERYQNTVMKPNVHPMSVDIEVLRSRGEKLLLECFENGSLGGDLDEFRDDPLVQGFESMRVETVSSLVRELKEAVGTPVSYIYMGGSGMIRRPSRRSPTNPTPCCTATTGQGQGSGESASQHHGGSGYVDSGLSASNMESAELMKEILLAAYEGGARRFSYYVYSMTPRRQFKWIGDAVSAVRQLDAQE